MPDSGTSDADNSTPGISIVVPSFNQGRYVKKLIESILEQEYDEFEIIFEDGGSKDETVEILKSYAHVPQLHWVSEPDDGPVDAVNKGLRKAKYEFVTIISTDDYFLPGTFAEAVRLLQSDEKLGLVYGEFVVEANDGTVDRIKTGPYSLEKLLSGITTVPQGAAFFRNSLAMKLGGWDERIPYVPDTDLWFRLALTSRVVKSDDILIGSHVHEGQRTNLRAKVIRDYRLMTANMKELENASFFERRAALAGLQLAELKYGPPPTDREATRGYLKSVWLYPPLLFSDRLPRHRLIPGYFFLTRVYRRMRQAFGVSRVRET